MRTNKTNMLHLTYSLDVGGIELLVLDLVRNLDNAVYDITICSMTEGGSLEEEFRTAGLKVHHCLKREGWDLTFIPKLAHMMKMAKIDILHTHNYASWIYGAVARRIAGCIGHVHTEHSNLPHNRMLALHGEYIASRLTDVVVADSNVVKSNLCNRTGIEDFRVQVIQNGIDIEKFHPARDKGVESSDRLTRIGIVARLVPVKNHDLLLRAFKKLKEKESGAATSLTIVGDGPLRADLEKLASQLGLMNFIEFMGSRRDVPEILRDLDIFVLSSKSEGFSLTLLEAMASGLPVVSTDVGGNREIVVDSQTGFLVPPDNIDLFAKKLGRLTVDRALARQMGREGRKRVEEMFSLRRMVARYEKAYSKILSL